MSGVYVDDTVAHKQLCETHSFSHKIVKMSKSQRVAIQRERMELHPQNWVTREYAKSAPDAETVTK